MGDELDQTDELVCKVATGDREAFARLFDLSRERLKQMVRIRLDPRLHGRLDPSDVIQEAYLDAARPLPEFVGDPAVPFFLWLRKLTAQRLTDIHRQHLGAKMRAAVREVSLYHGASPQASTLSLASQLLGAKN